MATMAINACYLSGCIDSREIVGPPDSSFSMRCFAIGPSLRGQSERSVSVVETLPGLTKPLSSLSGQVSGTVGARSECNSDDQPRSTRFRRSALRPKNLSDRQRPLGFG